MRRIREITAEEENFRVEPSQDHVFNLIRRDPVEPEPVGTILLMPVRIVGYDPDCDGSLMARLESLTLDEDPGDIDPEYLSADLRQARLYGLDTNRGLYPSSALVVTWEEVQKLAANQE